MKKTLVLIVLAVLCVALCGCATVRYSITIQDNGARTYEFSVTFDETVDTASEDIQAVKTFFSYYASQNPYSEFIFDEKSPRQVSLRISYENIEEYYLALGITGDETGDSIEGVSKGLFKVYTQTVFEKSNFVSYAVSYLSSTDTSFSTKFRDSLISNKGNADGAIKTDLEQVLASDNFLDAFSDVLSDSENREKIADYSVLCLKSAGYDFDKVAFYFDFSHCYDSIEGVNPDEIGKIENSSGKKQKVYTWRYDPTTSQKIQIDQTAPNTWVWELIAVIFGVAVGATCVAVFVIKSKKDKNKKIASPVGASENDNVNQDEELFSDSEEEKILKLFENAEDNRSDDDK